MIKYIYLFVCTSLFSQKIEITFPAFAGSTYEFVIFQGSKTQVITRDTIPKNGNFTLKVPEQFQPYKGMCRWLLTNSETGGGIDMAIPGHDFSITCLSDAPTVENIKFEGFEAIKDLDDLNIAQNKILERFDYCIKGLSFYETTHPLYVPLLNEKKEQQEQFKKFHESLEINPNYYAKLIAILNLKNGIATELTTNDLEKSILIKKYITNNLSFSDLYTSGHWDGVIENWMSLYPKNKEGYNAFNEDLNVIENRITDKKLVTELVTSLTQIASKYANDGLIEKIKPLVSNSKKMAHFDGILVVYKKELLGKKAPSLEIRAPNSKLEIMDSAFFAKKGYTKTLLLFYQTGCGTCEVILEQLPGNIALLKNKKIDVISISADVEQPIYYDRIKDFNWERKYCDFAGNRGVNFNNYAVIGTPMFFLISKDGIIEKQFSTLTEVLAYIK